MEDLLLDACCLLNLCSSGSFEDIVRALPYKFHVCVAVKSEALYVDAERDGVITRVDLDLKPWFDREIISLAVLAGANVSQWYVDFASALDDGEAMCLAIAKQRDWIIATDDRKTSSTASGTKIRVIGTPELICEWSRLPDTDQGSVGDVLQNISKYARFIPRRDDPLAAWWKQRSTP